MMVVEHEERSHPGDEGSSATSETPVVPPVLFAAPDIPTTEVPVVLLNGRRVKDPDEYAVTICRRLLKFKGGKDFVRGVLNDFGYKRVSEVAWKDLEEFLEIVVKELRIRAERPTRAMAAPKKEKKQRPIPAPEELELTEAEIEEIRAGVRARKEQARLNAEAAFHSSEEKSRQYAAWSRGEIPNDDLSKKRLGQFYTRKRQEAKERQELIAEFRVRIKQVQDERCTFRNPPTTVIGGGIAKWRCMKCEHVFSEEYLAATHGTNASCDGAVVPLDKNFVCQTCGLPKPSLDPCTGCEIDAVVGAADANTKVLKSAMRAPRKGLAVTE